MATRLTSVVESGSPMSRIISAHLLQNRGISRPDDKPLIVASSKLTKDQLLGLLLESDRPVTARQLERWWKATHLDRPTRRHVPGLRGSVSVFPAKAFEQASALYDAAHSATSKPGAADRRLDERAFLLWWSGKPIVHDPRQLLFRLSAPLRNAVQRLGARERVEVVGLEEDEDRAFDIADAIVQEHSLDRLKGALFGALSANLGHRLERLLSVMTAMTAAALGGMPLLEPSQREDEPSLATLVLEAFGFAQFLSKSSPEDQVEGALRHASIFANRAELESFLCGLTDDELDIARKCARTLFEEWPAVFEAQSILFGKSAMAKILRAYSRLATVGMKASAIVGTARILRQEGRDKVLRFLELLHNEAPKAHAICAAAKAFPKYRKLFTPKNVARLASLPEEEREKILAILKSAMA